MDRALWFLLGLRLKGYGRRWVRGLKSPKGIILAIFGLVVLVPWLMSVVASPGQIQGMMAPAARRYGPFALMTWLVVSLVFSTGERTLQFTPAEVNLLFGAPFTRRQLLAYKLWVMFGGTVILSLFLAMGLRVYSPRYPSAFVGMVLIVLFGQLFTMAVALIVATLGAAATTWRRRLALAVLVAVLLALGMSAGPEFLEAPSLEGLQALAEAPKLRAVLTPFRWFLNAFTAERVWPDLVGWGSLAAAVDAALVVLILALDANYLETAAAAGEKVYALREAVRRGGGMAIARKPGRVRGRVPMFPWWAGAGPLVWRQLTAARRQAARLVLMFLVFALVAGEAVFVLVLKGEQTQPWIVPTFQGLLVWMTMFLGPVVAFDFRADVDRMDALKSLPIAPWPLALGQLAAPVVLVTALQWLAMAPLAYFAGSRTGFWGVAALALPFNLLLFAVENLMFLWFPSRLAAGAAPSGDLQALGRFVLLFFAKMLALGLAGGFAAALGLALYFATGHNLAAALAAGWIGMAGVALALTPLIALAFTKFDVAGDIPP